jgi:hypothetical protein
MIRRFTRNELYDLVWSEPMKTLATKFELSDVGLAKTCRKHDVPLPPRGYWAKLRAGKAVNRAPLPDRGLGMSEHVELGTGRSSCSRPPMSDDDILAAQVLPLVFTKSLDELESEVRLQIGRVSIPRSLQKPHRFIGRLLDADEARSEKVANGRFPILWDRPKFESPFEKRRLRMVSGLFVALERLGAKPHSPDKEGRGLSVQVNGQSVALWVDDAAKKVERHIWQHEDIRNPSGRLKVALPGWSVDGEEHSAWEDNEDGKVEIHAKEIVAEVLLTAERQYRSSCDNHNNWLLERKAQILENRRLGKEEADRRERERLVKLEQDRIDGLLAGAVAFQKADTIRRYVADVEKRVLDGADTSGNPIVGQWAAWARAQADKIDPVISEKYLDLMAKTDPVEFG